MVLNGLCSYVFQVQVIPVFTELALDFSMETARKLLYRYRKFLATSLTVKLLTVILLFLHAGQIYNRLKNNRK